MHDDPATHRPFSHMPSPGQVPQFCIPLQPSLIWPQYCPPGGVQLMRVVHAAVSGVTPASCRGAGRSMPPSFPPLVLPVPLPPPPPPLGGCAGRTPAQLTNPPSASHPDNAANARTTDLG